MNESFMHGKYGHGMHSSGAFHLFIVTKELQRSALDRTLQEQKSIHVFLLVCEENCRNTYLHRYWKEEELSLSARSINSLHQNLLAFKYWQAGDFSSFYWCEWLTSGGILWLYCSKKFITHAVTNFVWCKSSGQRFKAAIENDQNVS